MNKRRKSQRGGSALEMALMLPWYLFLFVGTFDWGYYAHALISTESAARVAVLYTSQSAAKSADQSDACILANEEMRIVPNISSSGTPTCTASPLIVTATEVGPGQSTGSADNNLASQVTVEYTTVSLIPIPLLLPSSTTFYRVVQMRLRS
jgi:Flp pilus assembly protein TadG